MQVRLAFRLLYWRNLLYIQQYSRNLSFECGLHGFQFGRVWRNPYEQGVPRLLLAFRTRIIQHTCLRFGCHKTILIDWHTVLYLFAKFEIAMLTPYILQEQKEEFWIQAPISDVWAKSIADIISQNCYSMTFNVHVGSEKSEHTTLQYLNHRNRHPH